MAEGKLRNLLKILPIRDKFDAVILAIHACLVDKEFRCVGSGETKDVAEEFNFGEALPPDWNESQEVYALQYKRNGTGPLYLFKALKLGTMMAVYLMEEDESKMYDITINVDQYTIPEVTYNALRGQQDAVNKVYQHLDQFKAKLYRDVINKFAAPTSQVHGSQQNRNQTSQENQRRPLAGDPLRLPPRRPPDFRDEWSPPVGGPFPYGDGDRFPGHPGGGGMLMDPFRSGGLPQAPRGPTGPAPPGQIPRGSVPPGARFDPFGPIPPGGGGGARPDNRSGRFAGPDPDHLPPPGYDDMFM